VSGPGDAADRARRADIPARVGPGRGARGDPPATAAPPARRGAGGAASGPVGDDDLAPGVTAEVFAGAPSTRAPGQTVYLARFVFQPAARSPPTATPGPPSSGSPRGPSAGPWSRARPGWCAGRRPARPARRKT
jgi:hypothetical protein